MKVQHKIVKETDYTIPVIFTIVYILFAGGAILAFSWFMIKIDFLSGVIAALVGTAFATIMYMKNEIYKPMQTEEVEHIIIHNKKVTK